MKLISFLNKGKEGFGLAVEGGVVDLNGRLNGIEGVRQLLREERLNEAKSYSNSSADLGYNDITYLPPIPEAGKYICIGVNYPSRNEEYQDASKTPQKPSVFMR